MKIIFPKLILSIEKWKWSDKYQVYVSTYGNIKTKNKQTIPIKIGQGCGYVVFQLPSGQIKAAHRLVLETWRPMENMENLTVDHKNHNIRDNRINNLEWMTIERNQELAKQDLIDIEETFNSAIDYNQLTSKNLGKPIIQCGNKIFNSYNEIIDFLIDKKKITTNNINRKNIKNNIIKSIKSKSKYCNLYFELR